MSKRGEYSPLFLIYRNENLIDSHTFNFKIAYMIQINPNLVVLGVSEMLTPELQGYLKIFLSGSIAFSPKADWQQKFINAMTRLTDPTNGDPRFNDKQFVVINPKAPLQNPEMSLANQEFTQKTQWELQMYQQADAIFCNFLKKSVNPIAFNGLLYNALSQKVIVRCPAEYQFYPYINLVCLNSGIPLLGDSGTAVDVISKCFEVIPRFQEVASYGLQ